MSTVGNMGSAALGAAGGAVAGTWAAGAATNTAHNIAKAEGVSGFSNTAKSMGQSLLNARSSAKENNTSIRQQLSAQLDSLKGENILNNTKS